MTPEILFDYHTHHNRCGHACGELSEYIEAAIALGLKAIGVSDHGPAYFMPGDHAKPVTQMAISALPGYAAEAIALRARYADQIVVRLGVEADYIEGREDDLRTLLSSQPFEYVLGSVHYALEKNIFVRDRWKTEDAALIYRDYYRQIILAAQSGLFDILSHLTAVEAYGPAIAETLSDELYPPVADAVAASSCLVEVNTSGYRKMGGDEPFPNRRMLRLLIERGVPLTFGSDCHKPEEVGFGRDWVLSLLREVGVADDPQQIAAPRSGTPLWAFVTGGD